MSALLAAQSQSSAGSATTAPIGRSEALKHLFSQFDTNGDGEISKSEFESALGAGGTNTAQADDVFSKLDKDDSGTVSLDEMWSALRGKGHSHPHHVAAGSSGADGSNSDPLLQALQGASSTSVTNSDGSTTTSVTYAGGTKVTMTSARGDDRVQHRDLVLQCHRADDRARRESHFISLGLAAFRDGLSHFRTAST